MESKSFARSLVKGSLFAVILTILFTTVLSVVMCFVEINDGMFNCIYVVLSAIALVFGSIMGAKINGEKGFVVGGIVGILYYLMMLVFNFIIAGIFTFEFIKFIICIVIGVLSGMLGINLGSE